MASWDSLDDTGIGLSDHFEKGRTSICEHPGRHSQLVCPDEDGFTVGDIHRVFAKSDKDGRGTGILHAINQDRSEMREGNLRGLILDKDPR